MHFNFAAIATPGGLASLGQIILGDLTMAGDNVVVMGSLASGLPERDRRRVLLLGVGIALVFLIGFSLIAVELLQVTGLVLAGGLLLLWVAYNMFRELREARHRSHAAEAGEAAPPKVAKTFLQAAIQITLADLSMSLDNVLLVASIARENPALLFIGLSFSVLLMGLAANFVARLIQRYPWIGYIGLVVILWVAGRMIYEGIVDNKIGILHLLV
ncbi:YjbE family putative metal transport protein [Sphingomonas sp. JC676]|uniref:YjbE family putative metal transport protein n=1 Tax=Sphingomonas sp. JC676 TaxID=2768065 RepID=UPI001657699B|nr:YjbE family putative metal transport protein [Sphingomonas sp. JC676]MBC9034597.1 YjbE family putative metal transport protein [Sphingomonas sp. JC676]